MSKKPGKDTITTATIEEQTAAFLKSGGIVEYVRKGKSGQVFPTGSKQINLKGGWWCHQKRMEGPKITCGFLISSLEEKIK